MGKANDQKALADLTQLAAAHKEAQAIASALRARRDFQVVACYRRGISLRKIAAAAGLHFTRVRQLALDAADVAEAAHLKAINRKGKAVRRQTRKAP